MSGFCEAPHGIDYLRDGVQRIDREFCTTARLEKRQDVDLPGWIAVIDIANGEYVRATLFSDVRSLTIANWKPSPIVNRVTFEVNSKGKFSADLSWVRFPDGVDLSFSPDATVIFSIFSSDAGKTVFGSTVETYTRQINDPTPIAAAHIDFEPLKPQLG